MSHAASMHQPVILLRPNARASALGWGISVLAHVLAVAWLWHAWLPRRNDPDAAPVKRIVVWLVPLTPKLPLPLPAPVPKATLARAHRTPARAAPRPTPAPPQPPVSVVPAAPSNTVRAPPAETTESDATPPTVDLAAARAAARMIAREDEKGLVALPKRKPVVDPNADHHVVDRFERARRVNCETARANSANLLANVLLLAKDLVDNAIDDSGCKW